jgi:hypothetical protein
VPVETPSSPSEYPVNNIPKAAAAGDLAELEELVDYHWRLLSVVDKVRALLWTYAGC